MTTAAAVLLVAALYVLHQDVWFWNQAQPLVFGILPIGLFYHAAFTVATSLVMALLVRLLWPAELESEGRWADLFSRSQSELSRLAEEALLEHSSGETEELDPEQL